MIPSILSKIPPWPGSRSLVFLTFACRLIREINKSPNCEMNETDNVIKTISNKEILTYELKKSKKNGIKNSEKTKDPIDPDIVLFGLIFVNFFPLNILPTVSPPISVNTEIKTKYNITIYKSE